MRRNQLGLALFTIAVLLTGTATLGYRWMTSSRPVSMSDAVQRYRTDATVATPSPPPAAAAVTSGDPAPAAPLATVEPSSAAQTTSQPDRPAPTAAAETPEAVRPPPPGVYTYRTEGFEQAGFRRNYPSETQRIVTATDARTSGNHHIFSEEHEEWFTLHGTDSGGVMLERRMRITFGPVTVDQTVSFDPPLMGVPVPHHVGATWSGTWKGDVHGSYTGETIERRTIRIGAEDVEVFVNRLVMQLQGDSEGEVRMHLWYAPRHGLTVREDGVYTMQSRGAPGTYHTEYTMTLTSLQPQT